MRAIQLEEVGSGSVVCRYSIFLSNYACTLYTGMFVCTYNVLSYKVVLVGFRLEVLLGSLDEHYDVGEGSNGILEGGGRRERGRGRGQSTDGATRVTLRQPCICAS